MLENKLGDQADAFYSLLMEAHEGLEEDESHALNARLVLLFANEIGDVQTLSQLITLAKDAGAIQRTMAEHEGSARTQLSKAARTGSNHTAEDQGDAQRQSSNKHTPGAARHD